MQLERSGGLRPHPRNAPPFVRASERRRVQASDARPGRGRGVLRRAIGGSAAPASVHRQQRRADCSYPCDWALRVPRSRQRRAAAFALGATASWAEEQTTAADESEPPAIHDAGRRAAAPLMRGVFAAPGSRVIRIDPPSFAHACRALASLRRSGSRLFVCQGARCPSLALVRLAVADTLALGGGSERASRCRSAARSRKPLSAVRSTVGSNPTPPL
jgi:hypothetical protein